MSVAPSNVERSARLRAVVCRQLREGWSPASIAGRLPADYPRIGLPVSHEAIPRTAGLVTGRPRGRMILYRLAADFPAPLREQCLRRMVLLSRCADDPFPGNG